MFPLSDSAPSRGHLPLVNVSLIALNAVVFAYELLLGGIDREVFFYRYGLIPAELTGQIAPLSHGIFQTLQGPISVNLATPFPEWGTLFTAMFIHSSFMHFAGNMVFLWVFGDNLEHCFGRLPYLLFYLGAGLVATWTQIAVAPASQIPNIGASGAIAGVLGAYLLLFPYSRVRTVVFFFFFIQIVRIPAVFLLGFWFVLQFIPGIGELGASSQIGGVAYWAHIGGFVAGATTVVVARLLRGQPLIERRPTGIRPSDDKRPLPPRYWR